MVQLGIIKEDNIMSDNTNNGFPVPEEPLTREEQYLSAIAGVTASSDIPEKPLTRVEAYLNKIVENGGGGGGGGTTNYNALENKPQINGTTLSGNKTSSDLGLQDTISFEGTYNSSSNKAATMADIKDGKLTGYAQSSGNVAATDKIIEAIGKIEKKADDNQSNISSFHKASGTDIYFSETEPTGAITVGSYWISTDGIAIYSNTATATASTYTVTFTAGSGILTAWTISGNATQASTATPTSPVAVLGVGNLVSSGEHSGEYDVSITCGGVTNHIYIDDMLLNIESYADTGSRTAISRRIKKTTLTGSETITSVRANSNNDAYCCALKYSDIGMTDIIDYEGYMQEISYPKYISTHFVNKTVNNTFYNISSGEIGANSSASVEDRNRYIIICVSGLTTVQDYADWLTTQYNNGTPVEVYYIAATATETAITTPDIPTIDGSNTFTVGTTVNPSAVSVSYVGWTTNQ